MRIAAYFVVCLVVPWRCSSEYVIWWKNMQTATVTVRKASPGRPPAVMVRNTIIWLCPLPLHEFTVRVLISFKYNLAVPRVAWPHACLALRLCLVCSIPGLVLMTATRQTPIRHDAAFSCYFYRNLTTHLFPHFFSSLLSCFALRMFCFHSLCCFTFHSLFHCTYWCFVRRLTVVTLCYANQ